MRTTVALQETVLESARRRAAERGVTLSTVVEDALRMHLARPQTSSREQFQLPTVRGKLVNPRIDLDRTSALIVADDEAGYRDADA